MSSGNASFTRCDRTPAWGALKGQFEAHGRDFDVRFEVAFQRAPGWRAVAPRETAHFIPSIILSSRPASAAKLRMPSASFSVAIASSLSA